MPGVDDHVGLKPCGRISSVREHLGESAREETGIEITLVRNTGGEFDRAPGHGVTRYSANEVVVEEPEFPLLAYEFRPSRDDALE